MDQKFEIIKELMTQLEGMMQDGPDDLGERLGRPKPEVEIEVAASEPADEMGEEPMDDEMETDPGEKLKQRILKMRE